MPRSNAYLSSVSEIRGRAKELVDGPTCRPRPVPFRRRGLSIISLPETLRDATLIIPMSSALVSGKSAKPRCGNGRVASDRRRRRPCPHLLLHNCNNHSEHPTAAPTVLPAASAVAAASMTTAERAAKARAPGPRCNHRRLIVCPAACFRCSPSQSSRARPQGSPRHLPPSKAHVAECDQGSVRHGLRHPQQANMLELRGGFAPRATSPPPPGGLYRRKARRGRSWLPASSPTYCRTATNGQAQGSEIVIV